MRGLKIVAAALILLVLCSCGKEIKNYRIYDDLLLSFTEALGDRTLVSENLTKSEDGKVITEAEYVYKSDKPDEDKQSYLYYMINNYDAAFLSEDTVAVLSRDFDYDIIVKVVDAKDTFTINLTRRNMAVPKEE